LLTPHLISLGAVAPRLPAEVGAYAYDIIMSVVTDTLADAIGTPKGQLGALRQFANNCCNIV